MSVHKFSLHPFDSAINLATLNVSGTIDRSDHQLMLYYNLLDTLSSVHIPDLNLPDRKHDLWKTTCFEFFLGVPDASQYWEFNVSPSGDWNVYRFEQYRTGMQEETALASRLFRVERKSNELSLIAGFDISSIVQPNQPLDVGITAVIQLVDRSLSYWAIEHCGIEADFHLRDSFALKI